jgi:hypothetical protein
VKDRALAKVGADALAAIRRAGGWLIETMQQDALGVEAGARGFSLTIGRSIELALLARQAQHALDTHGDARSRSAALRLATERYDFIGPNADRASTRALAMDDVPL